MNHSGKILLGCLVVLGSVAAYVYWKMNYDLDHLNFGMLTEETGEQTNS